MSNFDHGKHGLHGMKTGIMGNTYEEEGYVRERSLRVFYGSIFSGFLERHLSADSAIREDFQKKRMREPSIHKMDFADAGVEGIDRGADFRDHAAGDGAVCDEGVGLFDVDGLDQRGRVFGIGEQAGDIREVNEF